MQTISSSVNVASSNPTDVKEHDFEMTVEKLKFATTALKTMVKTMLNKVDKNGHIQTLLQIVKGEKLEEEQPKVEGEKIASTQVLAKFDYAGQKEVANRVFLCAAMLTLVSFSMGYIPHTQIETDKPMVGRFRNEANNFFFLVSGVLWFEGFILLIDYLFDTKKDDMRDIVPLGMKLWASALFTIRPMTTLILGLNASPESAPPMLKWSDFMAIFMFHISSMMSLGFAFMKDYSSQRDDYFKNNASIFGMLLYTVGSALLLISAASFHGVQIDKTKETVLHVIGSALLVFGAGANMAQNTPATPAAA
jgi:hypothetical protein